MGLKRPSDQHFDTNRWFRNLSYLMVGLLGLLALSGLVHGPLRLVGVIHMAAVAATLLYVRGLRQRRLYRLIGILASLASGILWAEMRARGQGDLLESLEGRQLLTLVVGIIWMLVLTARTRKKQAVEEPS